MNFRTMLQSPGRGSIRSRSRNSD